jgi:hypothetical protein
MKRCRYKDGWRDVSALRLVAFRGWKYGFTADGRGYPNALISPRGTVFQFNAERMVARKRPEWMAQEK